jgi:hypothetical protein
MICAGGDERERERERDRGRMGCARAERVSRQHGRKVGDSGWIGDGFSAERYFGPQNMLNSDF